MRFFLLLLLSRTSYVGGVDWRLPESSLYLRCCPIRVASSCQGVTMNATSAGDWTRDKPIYYWTVWLFAVGKISRSNASLWRREPRVSLVSMFSVVMLIINDIGPRAVVVTCEYRYRQFTRRSACGVTTKAVTVAAVLMHVSSYVTTLTAVLIWTNKRCPGHCHLHLLQNRNESASQSVLQQCVDKYTLISCNVSQGCVTSFSPLLVMISYWKSVQARHFMPYCISLFY